jgi:hypothetical protein
MHILLPHEIRRAIYLFLAHGFAERFLGRTYLEEIKGTIKKLLRVQEDESKYVGRGEAASFHW